MTFLVIALEIVCDAFPLEDFLQGSAKRFSPHVSILPRFTSEEPDAIAFSRVEGRKLLPISIELTGPKELDDMLEWYECDPSDQGFHQLVALHDRALSQLSASVRPWSSQHWGKDYRPHMTIRSDLKGELSRTLPPKIVVQPRELVLYEYALSDRGSAKRRSLLML